MKRFVYIFVAILVVLCPLMPEAWSLESKCLTTNEYIDYAKNTITDNWKPHYGEESGNILLIFKIKNTGEIFDIKILQSGGSILDTEAINTLKKLSPLDSFPKIYHCDYMEATFDFKYQNYKEKKQVEEQNMILKKENVKLEESSATFYYK